VLPSHFELVFSTISQERTSALLVGVEPFFWTAAEELIALAAQHVVPAIYDRSLFPAVSGLISYGARESELNRLMAAYVSRILRGAKPADLPVQLPTKFEFVINLMTARHSRKIPQSVSRERAISWLQWFAHCYGLPSCLSP
jgi:putative tryptophan/tyrosine transport system substrate-binding protein